MRETSQEIKIRTIVQKEEVITVHMNQEGWKRAIVKLFRQYPKILAVSHLQVEAVTTQVEFVIIKVPKGAEAVITITTEDAKEMIITVVKKMKEKDLIDDKMIKVTDVLEMKKMKGIIKILKIIRNTEIIEMIGKNTMIMTKERNIEMTINPEKMTKGMKGKMKGDRSQKGKM